MRGYRGSTAEKWVKYFDYEKGLSFSALDGIVGDVNNDNKVDSKDAVIVLKYYAETLTGFSGGIEDYLKK